MSSVSYLLDLSLTWPQQAVALWGVGPLQLTQLNGQKRTQTTLAPVSMHLVIQSSVYTSNLANFYERAAYQRIKCKLVCQRSIQDCTCTEYHDTDHAAQTRSATVVSHDHNQGWCSRPRCFILLWDRQGCMWREVRGFDPPQEVVNNPQKVLQNLFGGSTHKYTGLARKWNLGVVI